MKKDEEQEDVDMAINQRELTNMQQKIMSMSKEERREFVRKQTNQICDRNDTVLRRLSKS